jgi:hypothetical protein
VGDRRGNDEDWFSPKDTSEEDETTQIEQYLYAAREWFWNGTKEDINYVPTLSGYTTTRNCISQNYPYEATIRSMLGFCDEVIVVDGGSSDGTWERLQELAKNDDKLKVYQEEIDWEQKRFALYDGILKAKARDKCTMDYCWQMDSDEVAHENDYEKIKNITRTFPANVDLLALPVIEYWGGPEKVRMDINPWKWRLSRNRKYITHGVPSDLRVQEENGGYYAKQGTDGCDYIVRDSGERVAFANFFMPGLLPTPPTCCFTTGRSGDRGRAPSLCLHRADGLSSGGTAGLLP